jgi:hypothetical protein
MRDMRDGGRDLRDPRDDLRGPPRDNRESRDMQDSRSNRGGDMRDVRGGGDNRDNYNGNNNNYSQGPPPQQQAPFSNAPPQQYSGNSAPFDDRAAYGRPNDNRDYNRDPNYRGLSLSLARILLCHADRILLLIQVLRLPLLLNLVSVLEMISIVVVRCSHFVPTFEN